MSNKIFFILNFDILNAIAVYNSDLHFIIL